MSGLFLSRRTFLGGSLTGLAASSLWGADESTPKPKPSATFQPTSLFLTWQRDPTTTMTIQWIGAAHEVADTSIRFAKHSSGQESINWQTQPTASKPYPLTELQVFRSELTGLTPGTDYQFQIGTSSPAYRFRTMPANATDTISFISGGDVGINPHAIANNIQAARQDPMFTVIGGDLGYDDGKRADISLAFIRNYAQHMIGRHGRLIPMIPCIGNHEVDGGYGKPREKAPFFYALFDGLFRETSYTTLDFGDYLSLVLLDTGHNSAIGGVQTDWLENVLKERREHPHVMAVNHVPAYPSARKMVGIEGKAGTGEENRKHWVPLFEKYRVPVVLEHHDHTFKRSKPLLNGLADSNGVLYLGDGSWGKLRTPQKPENLPHLALVQNDYHLSLHRLQGQERFHLALDEHGKVMDACRTAQRTTS